MQGMMLRRQDISRSALLPLSRVLGQHMVIGLHENAAPNLAAPQEGLEAALNSLLSSSQVCACTMQYHGHAPMRTMDSQVHAASMAHAMSHGLDLAHMPRACMRRC